MKRFRRLRWIVLGLVVLAVVVLVGGWAYFSHHASDLVASRLSTMYGGKVQAGGVQVGLGASSVRDLKFHAVSDSGESVPWATVDKVRADVSVWELVRGVTPHRLTVEGLDVTLHFDRDGHLLTKLPATEGGTAALPAIHLESGSLHLHQDGRPPMDVQGISGDLHEEDGQWVLNGQVADPTWEHWDVSGRLRRADRTGSLELRTEQVHATMDKLRSLPYVSPRVWREVQVEGDTPVDFTLKVEAGGQYHYTVAMQPRATSVRLPLIDLSASQVQGKLGIDDGVIHVDDATGQVAGGTLKTSGVLNYMVDPSKLDFQVSVQRVDVKQLPAKWHLPPEIEGKLTGQADLHIRIVNGEYQTSGEGKGVINDARVAGLPAEPIQLSLHTEGNGYRFQTDQKAVRADEGPKVRVAQRFPQLSVLLVLAAQAPTANRASALDLPIGLVNRFVSGLSWALGEATQATHTALKYFPAPGPDPHAKAATPAPPPSYLTVNLKLNDVDVQQLAERLQLQLPFSITGRLSFQVTASLPVNATRDLKAYRLHGSATSARLVLENLAFEKVTARVVYEHGVLHLEELRGFLPDDKRRPGSFAGQAQYQYIPQGDLTAQLQLSRVPLVLAGRLVPELAGVLDGIASGSMQARVARGNLRDLSAWDVTGDVTSPQATAFGLTLDAFTARLRLARGVASVRDLRGKLAGSPISAAGELTLTAPYPFQGSGRVTDFSLAALNRLAPQLRPPFTLGGSFQVTGDAKGTLQPFALQAAGSLNTASLSLKGFTLRSLAAHWQADRDRVTLNDLRGSLYDGTVTGQAVVPLHETVPGRIDLSIKDLDLAALTKAVPAIPLHLHGKADGTIDGTLTAAQPNKPRAFTGKVSLTSPKLIVQNVPTDKLHGTISYTEQKVTYELTGETLGGTFQLNGSVPTARGSVPEQGRLRIRDVRLGRLWRSLSPRRDGPAPIGGLLSVDIAYQQPSLYELPTGRGTFRIQELAWGPRRVLNGALEGGILIHNGEARLRNISGSLGQGFFRAAGAYDLQHAERSWLFFALDGVEASRLFAPWPELAGIAGPLDLRVRASLGRVWRGEATFFMARGHFNGIEVSDMTLPLDFHYYPRSAAGTVDLRDGHANVARGRVTGNAHLSVGQVTTLQGSLRFSEVNLRTLIAEAGSHSTLGSGRLTGRADFQSHDLHSINDVTGEVYAKLHETQPLQMPVLSQVTPFVGFGSSSAGTFTSGDLRGQLSRGVFRIQQLSLAGNTLKLYVDGTITLQGRLNLTVLMQVGFNTPSLPFLRLLGLRIPATGAIPVGLIFEASNYLSNRLIHLRVTGTVHSPTVQIQPISLLTQDAVRFFLNRAAVPVP